MAHKKDVGSLEGGGESHDKRLGVKKFGGEVVIPGNIIVRQRGIDYHVGPGVGVGMNHTLYATVPGTILFTKKNGSKMVSVIATDVKPTYLTKRLLVRLSSKAFREASQEAMRVMGHIVIEQDGWVVRKFEDGHIEKIRELEKSYGPLIFD